jgi:hypothetical protein
LNVGEFRVNTFEWFLHDFDRCWFSDSPITVDKSRDASIDGADHGDSVFDAAECGGDQVLVKFAAAMEPAVIGEVDEQIAGVSGSIALCCHVTHEARDSVFKADEWYEPPFAVFEELWLLAGINSEAGAEGGEV